MWNFGHLGQTIAYVLQKIHIFYATYCIPLVIYPETYLRILWS